MYLGRIVEIADADALFAAPGASLYAALLSAIPPSHPDEPRHRTGSSAICRARSTIPHGCRFASALPLRAGPLPRESTRLLVPADGRLVACHRAADGTLPIPILEFMRNTTPCPRS